MRWPWRRVEEREDLGNAVGEAYLAGITRGTAEAPAAVDAAAAIWAGALAGCNVSGEFADMVDWPEVLHAVGDSLIRRGAYLARIDVTGDTVTLREAWDWDWQGTSARPTVRLTESTLCQTTEARTVPAEGVLWLRWRDDPAQPWTATPPVTGGARKWAAEGERALGDELAGDVTTLLPAPRAENPDADKQKRQHGDTATKIRQSRGRTVLVPSTTAHWGDEGKAPAATEWQPRRLGPEPPTSVVTATDTAHRFALEQCGIPPGLMDATSAQASREALRRFALLALAPMAKRIEAELRRKLDPSMKVEPDIALMDLQGRTAAFRALTGAEMPASEAAEIVGLKR